MYRCIPQLFGNLRKIHMPRSNHLLCGLNLHVGEIFDNTQTGLQHSDRLDLMGTGTIELDDNRQLQLVTQYYKSQGDDDYGLDLGKNMSAVSVQSYYPCKSAQS